MIENLWFVRYEYLKNILEIPQVPMKEYCFIGTNWSLGIEEQFYIVWPFVLACIFKSTRARKFVIVGSLIGLSYGLAMMLIWFRISWIDGYFFPVSRYWELFAGCFLAIFEF